MTTPQERQAKYIAKKKAKGECVRCKNKAVKGKVLCAPCFVDRREYERKRAGHKAWRKGGRGRPPKY